MIRLLGILNPVQYYKLLSSVRTQKTLVFGNIQTRRILIPISSYQSISKQLIDNPRRSERAFHKQSKQTPSLPRNSMDSPSQQEQDIDLELRDRAHKICCEHLGGAWNKITAEEMTFKPIT